jgi:hypothetical protein
MRGFMEDAEFEGTLKAESPETGYIAARGRSGRRMAESFMVVVCLS